MGRSCHVTVRGPSDCFPCQPSACRSNRIPSPAIRLNASVLLTKAHTSSMEAGHSRCSISSACRSMGPPYRLERSRSRLGVSQTACRPADAPDGRGDTGRPRVVRGSSESIHSSYARRDRLDHSGVDSAADEEARATIAVLLCRFERRRGMGPSRCSVGARSLGMGSQSRSVWTASCIEGCSARPRRRLPTRFCDLQPILGSQGVERASTSTQFLYWARTNPSRLWR